MHPAIYLAPLGLLALGAGVAGLLTWLEPGSRQRLVRRRSASPLAHLLPHWHASDDGVLVGVDLAYSAGLALEGIDTDCLDDGDLEQVAASLHALLHALPAGLRLQVLHQTDRRHGALLDRYVAQAAGGGPVSEMLVADRRAQIEGDTDLRRSRLLLILTQPAPSSLGGRFRRQVDLSPAAHAERSRQIASLRDQVARGLEGAGLSARALRGRELVALAYERLNPARSAQVGAPQLRPAPEQTLREQLAFSGVTEGPRDLVVDGQRIRVLSLRQLPTETEPALLEALTVSLPFEATVQLGVELLDDQRALDALKRKRNQAQTIAASSARRNQEAEAQHHEVASLIDQNLHAALRMVRLSLSVVLAVPDDDRAGGALDAQTAEVLRLLARMYGAEGMVEEYGQLDSWLATLPGNVGHAGRWHTCTSENAAHLLLAWQSWPGHARPSALFENRRNYLVGLDPFDGSLDNPNAFMAGASGAGKSVTTNYLLASLLASGGRALIVDVGGSYRKLIELFGGDYLSFDPDRHPALNLFYAPDELLDEAGDFDPLRLQFVLSVLEMLATDAGGPALANAERAVLDMVVQAMYRHYAPHQHTPLLGELVAYLAALARDEGWHDAEDRRIARRLSKALGYWTQGSYGRLFNRPSTIRLTSDFVGFDLKGLPKDARGPVVLILSALIWNLVQADPEQRKMVVFDEVWTLLESPAAARMLEELYRTSRKYRCSILAISQDVEDFTRSSIAGALVNNSATAYILRHRKGHEAIADAFHLNDRELDLFKRLEMRHGDYSELLVLAGSHHVVARLALTPLEYWIATSHPPDRAALSRVRDRHPHLSLLDALRMCAARWPRGVRADLPAGDLP